MELQKHNNNIANNSEGKSEDEISVGDIFIYDRYRDSVEVIRIYSLKPHKDFTNYEYERLRDVLNKEWRLYKYDESQNRTISQRELKEYYKKVTEKEFDLWVEQAKAFLETGELIGFDQADDSSLNSETALVGVNSKEYLTTMQNGLEEKKGQLEGMQHILDMRMKEQKRKMDVLREEINNKVALFQKQIKKLVRIITMIELYLGIEEELHQIQEGASADIKEPITFRQQVLYMDEETAIISDGGLDWKRINEFDEWLLKDKNYEKIFPEQRGIICLKPRRNMKDYGNHYTNQSENKYNKLDSYFLIRNGENIYRIFTEKIIVPERLFPRRTELNDMFNELDKNESSRDKEKAQEAADDKMFFYRKLVFFYQGLIDRTNVFHPIEQPISISKMEEYPEKFNFIYDDELTLPDGKLPFWDWQKQINEKIERGSRVIISNVNQNKYGGYISNEDYRDRLFYYCNKYNIPNSPNSGLYEVEVKYEDTTEALPHYYIDELEKQGRLIKKESELVEGHLTGYADKQYDYHYLPKDDTIIKTFIGKGGTEYIEFYKCTFKKEIFSIKYNPKNTVYGSWGSHDSHERKNRISWKIYKRDNFVFNYDQIDTELIHFYLNSRTDRHNYCLMIPMLLKALKNRNEELAWEKNFVNMVVDEAARKLGDKLNREKCEAVVWECIEWWKHKVIMKRPITKDDEKALRMIQKRVMSDANRKKITN